MQTFLPSRYFEESAESLDVKRLGKQRVETLGIAKAIKEQILLERDETIPRDQRPLPGWFNHPATQMWVFYPHWLCRYGMVMTQEWVERGFRDSCMPKFVEYLEFFSKYSTYVDRPPPWLGNQHFHSSHRRVLKAKNPQHYTDFSEEGCMAYIWPKLIGDDGSAVTYRQIAGGTANDWPQTKIDSSWRMWEQNTETFLPKDSRIVFLPAAKKYIKADSVIIS